jgi:hypothetical protein
VRPLSPTSRANADIQSTMDFEACSRNVVACKAALLLTRILHVSPLYAEETPSFVLRRPPHNPFLSIDPRSRRTQER